MTQSGKVTAAVAVVLALAAVGLWAQISSTKTEPISVTAQQLELYVSEYEPLSRQQQLASDSDQKKAYANQLKERLALGQVAEIEGHLKRQEVREAVRVLTDAELQKAYVKKHPGVKLSDDEVNSFYKGNPGVFEAFLAANPAYQRYQGPDREALKRAYGELKLAAERATQERLDEDEAVKLRLMIVKYELLANFYQNDLRAKTDKSVTDADIAAFYKEHAVKGEFDEVRARHILIATDKERIEEQETDKQPSEKEKKDARPLTKEEARKKAEAILARVRAGEDFAKLAEENSDDPGSQAKGGDLGYFTKGQNVPQFDEVAFSLTPVQVSDLVETEFGYHIIKVEDRRTPPLDIRTQQTIAATLKKQKQAEAIERIVAKSKVDIAERFNVTPKGAGQPQPSASPTQQQQQ